MRTVAEPLLKVTLNLYAKDVEWFKRKCHSSNYTEQIREALRAHIRYIEFMIQEKHDEHSQ
jgi:hypothetical protein